MAYASGSTQGKGSGLPSSYARATAGDIGTVGCDSGIYMKGIFSLLTTGLASFQS